MRDGLNAPYNPFWSLVDPDRIGIAGHSFGAFGVSFVGQKDPRVKAIVALDNLRKPDEAPPSDCATAPETRTPAPITKPALAISNDYGLFRQFNTSEPDPMAKSEASLAYSAAGVDTGELVIRGGTHYEPSYIPNHHFSATLRGIDLVAWYTAAWFDRHLRHDPAADARLATTRWQADEREAAVDPTGDGNHFSRYYRSRLDVGLGAGGRLVCEDVRAGCPGMAPDGEGDYGYLAAANTPDRPGAGDALAPPASLPSRRSCRSRRRLTIRVARTRRRVRSVTVRVNGRRVRRVTGRRARVPVSLRGLPSGRARVRVTVRYVDGSRRTIARTYRTCARRR